MRRFLVLVLAGLAIWATMDFLGFCRRTATLVPPTSVSGDAAISLTGGGGLRIAAGVALVETGAAERLLVSGVHPDVTIAEIAALAGGSPEVYACCVDIGYVAETTRGNAEETASWALERNYDDLIIVTSDYHMPRSLILLERAMPDVRLAAYPVRTRIDPSKPFSSWRTFRGLVWEWSKWRVTLAGGDKA